MTELKGRTICKGKASGEILKTKDGISFYGGVNGDTGIVEQEGHELKGQSIAGKILVFPEGKGSTVGSYILYRLKKNGKAPAAIVNKTCETIVAVGCIISEIPCIDQIDLDKLENGKKAEVDAGKGVIKIE
jgi:predicted aconitase with swiveling domain